MRKQWGAEPKIRRTKGKGKTKGMRELRDESWYESTDIYNTLDCKCRRTGQFTLEPLSLGWNSTSDRIVVYVFVAVVLCHGRHCRLHGCLVTLDHTIHTTNHFLYIDTVIFCPIDLNKMESNKFKCEQMVCTGCPIQCIIQISARKRMKMKRSVKEPRETRMRNAKGKVM